MIPALQLFIFAGLFSPGPNVVLLIASGARFGLRATLPHLFGIVAGVGVIGGIVGMGLGGLLIRESLKGAPAQDWDRVLLVGDAPYYSRFGFEPLSGVVMPPPTNPKRVLGLPLVANGWIGIIGSVSSMRS